MSARPLTSRLQAEPSRIAVAVSLALAAWLWGCDGELQPAERFVETCAELGCGCRVSADCDDAEPCTVDTCLDGSCLFAVLDARAGCEDGDPCTVDDTCKEGVCSGDPRVCDDGNPCTADACAAGKCTFTVTEGPCDDGDGCTTGDTCAAGKCVAGAPRPLFQKTLPAAGDNHARGVARAPGDGVYIAGFTLPKPQQWQARVLRLDAAGGVVWDKTYPSGISAQLYGATADGAGGVYVVGIWFVTEPNPTLENWRPVVLRLDSKGNELWKQIDAKGGKLEPVSLLPNGDVLALGYEQFQPPSRPTAWRLGSKGGKEIERILLGGNQYYGRLYASVVEADGGVLVVGRRGNEGPGSDGLVARYEGTGVFTPLATVGQANVDDALRAVALLPDGRRVAVGQRLTNPATAWMVVQKPDDKPKQVALDSPNKGGYAGLEALATAGDGTLVAGGVADTTGADFVWWLAGLNAKGERKWSKVGPALSGGGTNDAVRACVATAKGDVVCVGEQSEQAGSTSHDVLVLRVDATGKASCP